MVGEEGWTAGVGEALGNAWGNTGQAKARTIKSPNKRFIILSPKRRCRDAGVAGIYSYSGLAARDDLYCSSTLIPIFDGTFIPV